MRAKPTAKLTILQEAIGTGEVLKVKYYGGSQPGAVRKKANH